MTTAEKARITALRNTGLGYKRIAQELGISENSVKTFCRRNGLTAETRKADDAAPPITPLGVCLFCGEPVTQLPGRKKKKFCCKDHRNRWWNQHICDEKRGAMDVFTCPGCGTEFYAYRRHGRKYCSHECYVKARFGGGSCE